LRKNPHAEANRNLDQARDCFLKATFHLTEPNRHPNGIVDAILYGTLGILKLAAGDLSGRARARAEEVLREMMRTAK
jgi:hypothetical protein